MVLNEYFFIVKLTLCILLVRETEEQAYKLVSQFQLTKNFSMKRNKYYEKWNASTANQLAALRSKIEQTKHLANGVFDFTLNAEVDSK